MDEGRYRVLSRQLGRSLDSELEKLGGSTSRIASAAWRPVSVAAPTTKRRLAIVAADAGNVTLRLNPLRIAFVRVASSDLEEPLAELIFQPDEPAAALSATKVTRGDEVFIYETKTGPHRKQEVDSEEVIVERQPGRQGVIGVARVTGSVEDRREDKTLWDGKQFNFRFVAPTEALWDSGFAGPSQLRRALGWDSDAPIRNLALREIDADTAAELRQLLRVRDDAPIVRERRSSRLDELADEEAKRGAFRPNDDADERERVLASIAARRGQPEFRRKLLAAYGGRCAISGCDFADALEACHIVPHSGPRSDRVVNGLLLRADLHTLFDRGWIGVEPDSFRVVVHQELMASEYAKLSGRRIRLPKRAALRPDREALRMQCHRAALAAE